MLELFGRKGFDRPQIGEQLSVVRVQYKDTDYISAGQTLEAQDEGVVELVMHEVPVERLVLGVVLHLEQRAMGVGMLAQLTKLDNPAALKDSDQRCERILTNEYKLLSEDVILCCLRNLQGLLGFNGRRHELLNDTIQRQVMLVMILSVGWRSCHPSTITQAGELLVSTARLLANGKVIDQTYRRYIYRTTNEEKEFLRAGIRGC